MCMCVCVCVSKRREKFVMWCMCMHACIYEYVCMVCVGCMHKREGACVCMCTCVCVCVTSMSMYTQQERGGVYHYIQMKYAVLEASVCVHSVL